MRASYVDRMLAQVDGTVAPIWITLLLVTSAPPDVTALRAAVATLVSENERLRMQWDPSRADWCPCREGREALVRRWGSAQEREHVAALVADRIDLTTDAPLRLTLAPLADAPEKTLLAIQIHHAVGDARSLMHLTSRLWELLVAGAHAPRGALGPAVFRDRLALRHAARHAAALPSIVRAEHRILARRGTALRRSGDDVGAPMLRSLRVPLPVREHRGDSDREPNPAHVFYGALLAGIAAHGVVDTSAPIRFRVPVDLRREMGLGPAIENACSALPVELPWDDVVAARDPLVLGARLLDELARSLRRGVHWATLVECIAVARVASVAMLRKHTRPELLASRRGSTMVATYVGRVDRYMRACPFPVESLRTHTPTWGANGLCYDGALVINVGAFDRLWRPDELDTFLASMRGALSEVGIVSEVLT